MATQKLNLTRDQLASFLKNHELVKQFEKLIQVVDEVSPATDTQGIGVQAANADAAASEALAQIVRLAQDVYTDVGSADHKATQALDTLGRIAGALEMLAAAPLLQNNNSVSTDYVDFLPSPRYSRKPGRVHWGSTGTLEIEMGGGNITQQVGEEFFAYGKATAAITNGQLVMVTGAVGASGTITFAPTTTGLLDPNAILGIATEDIPLNGFGRVTTMGIVRGINTTGSSVGEVWADGDVLWYNTTAVGSMTKVKPSAPNMKTQVAIVINAGSGGSGSLQVEVVHGSTLGGTDSNVQLGALVDKQLLQYDLVLGYWKNVALASIGSTASETHAAASKATPVDADELPLVDSAASFALKRLTWANLKATLATWINANLIPASFTSVTSSTTAKVATTLGVGNATPSASGSGVSFPATQSASTDANTLDDYEEGSWTPSVLGSTINGAATYTTRVGRYTKVGNKVTAVCQMIWTAHTGTGNTLISGLPFATANVTGLDQFVLCMSNNLTIVGLPVLAVTPNQTVGTLYSLAAGSLGNVTLDTAATLSFSFTYLTS